jgi:imidazolonepropionase-like amidohydrolase
MMNWAQNVEAEGWRGTAAGYQQAGVMKIGFNTDAPVMPQEELSLQATIAVRYGFDDTSMQAMRGLTIIPATIAGIQHRTGSLEVGKEADILIVTGHPADQRSSIERVWLDGHDVYNAEDKREY